MEVMGGIPTVGLRTAVCGTARILATGSGRKRNVRFEQPECSLRVLLSVACRQLLTRNRPSDAACYAASPASEAMRDRCQCRRRPYCSAPTITPFSWNLQCSAHPGAGWWCWQVMTRQRRPASRNIQDQVHLVDRGALRPEPAMRRQRDIWGSPQRILHRKRFGLKHIQRRMGDMAIPQRFRPTLPRPAMRRAPY